MLSSESRLSNRRTHYAGDVAGQGRCSKRSHAPFTDEHLKRLVKIALEDQEGLFERNPRLAIYRKRLKLVALCQGGALHLLDCKEGLKHTNGVKDLDVYSFYAEHPKFHGHTGGTAWRTSASQSLATTRTRGTIS